MSTQVYVPAPGDLILLKNGLACLVVCPCKYMGTMPEKLVLLSSVQIPRTMVVPDAYLVNNVCRLSRVKT